MLTFAVMFYVIAAHAFVYQDIGRRGYGEIVIGGAAIAVGAIMCIMSTWAATLYFKRARDAGVFSWFAVMSFALLVAFCMASQLGFWFWGASRWLARILTLAVTVVAWPFVCGIHWFPEEIRRQENRGPTSA